MGTYANIQTRVNRRVIDLPAAVTAEVPELINEAMETLQIDHNFKVMETETAILTTTVATRTLSTAAVPSNFKELRGLPYLISNTGAFTDLFNPANRRAVMRAETVSDPQAKGEPKYILDGEPNDLGVRNWEVYPFPDGASDFSDDEYRIVIPYWRFLPELSADADTNWFTVNAETYLVFQATSEAFALDWDEERMAVWAQKAANERNKIIKRDKLFRLGGVQTLVPHLNVHGSRLRT